MTISKMQTAQSNSSTNSTQGNPLSIKIEEQENGETWVSISPTRQLVLPPLPRRMTTPRPPTPKTAQDGWETTVGLPTAPHIEPHTSGKKWKAENKLARSTTSCYGQHATTTGAKPTFEKRKLRDGFPKTDLGLCHYQQDRETTKSNRGSTTKTELPGTNVTRTNVSSIPRNK